MVIANHKAKRLQFVAVMSYEDTQDTIHAGADRLAKGETVSSCTDSRPILAKSKDAKHHKSAARILKEERQKVIT